MQGQFRADGARRQPIGYASFDYRVGDVRIVTSSATPANRHFRSYPRTGKNVDIAEPTRFTQIGHSD
jgi:hypothetical protein